LKQRVHQLGTSQPGSLTIDIAVTPNISGQEITSAIGVVDPADQVVGLTGQSITSTQGTAVAPNEDVSVTGQSITSTLGDSIVSVGTLIIPTSFEITSIYYTLSRC
jgi:hypothetical protein